MRQAWLRIPHRLGLPWDDEWVAVVFELVINFGTNRAAVQAAVDTLTKHPSVMLRGVAIPVTPPSVSNMKTANGDLDYIEFSVHPRGICYGGPGLPAPLDVRTLSIEELTSVGEQLFEVLRRFDGYNVAAVGWDPEEIIEPRDLQNELLPDGIIYRLGGVVVSNSLARQWGLDARFVPFRRRFSVASVYRKPTILLATLPQPRAREQPERWPALHRRDEPEPDDSKGQLSHCAHDHLMMTRWLIVRTRSSHRRLHAVCFAMQT